MGGPAALRAARAAPAAPAAPAPPAAPAAPATPTTPAAPTTPAGRASLRATQACQQSFSFPQAARVCASIVSAASQSTVGQPAASPAASPRSVAVGAPVVLATRVAPPAPTHSAAATAPSMHGVPQGVASHGEAGGDGSTHAHSAGVVAEEAEAEAEWEGGEGGVCLHLRVQLRPHAVNMAGPKTEEAEALATLTAAIRDEPDQPARYYARACRLLQLRLFAEAVST